MKIESEAALDELVICHKCHTVHKEIPIKDGAKACCSECGSVLYRYDSKLIDHGLALSLTALIFFFMANLFPLVKIEILGHTQYITLTKTFLSLFQSGFYIVGMLCLFLIFLFPLIIMLDIYLNQSVHISEIWMLRRRYYGKEGSVDGSR